MHRPQVAATVFLAQPHHHVDTRDLVAGRRGRHAIERDLRIGNVDQRVLALDEEMMMIRHVGVEIGLRAVDRDLAQQADIGELVQRVVDGRERDRDLGLGGLLVQHLGGEMPVALGEQDPAERHPLAGRAQPDLAQHRFHVVPGAAGQVGARTGTGAVARKRMRLRENRRPYLSHKLPFLAPGCQPRGQDST